MIPRCDERLMYVEVKASHTVAPADACSLERLAEAPREYEVERAVVYRGDGSAAGTALRPGVRALNLAELLKGLAPGRRARG